MVQDGDSHSRVERELLLCWLALSVAQVAERAASVRRATSVAFASVGPRGTSRDSLSEAQTLAHCVAAIVSDRSFLGQAHSDRVRINVAHGGVPQVDTVAQASRRAVGTTTDKTLLVVVGSQASGQHISAACRATLSNAGVGLVLSITRASALTPDAPRWPWTCSLLSLSLDPHQGDACQFLQHPLDHQSDQCGWRIALEVLSRIDSAPAADARQETPPPMFTTAGQLPFQLLLLLLRWSFFHPSVVRLLGKKLRRQLELTPTSRTRRDVLNAQQLGRRLWRRLYPEETTELSLSPRSAVNASSLASRTTSPAIEESAAVSTSLPPLDRLSKCQLWDAQKQFYIDRGIQAWSAGIVPFGVSSSSFIAAAYARVAIDFLLSQETALDNQTTANGPNCFVWEAASGSCKFLHHFLLHFYTGVERNAAAFRRRKLVPLVVASDLSEQVLASRMQMPCFRPYLERGQLDFARFDTAAFVSGPDAGLLRLKRAGRAWLPGRDGPLFLMGNYFFDSLRTDVFALTRAESTLAAPRPGDSDGSSSSQPAGDRCFVHEAVLDPNTLSIAEMDLAFRAPVEVSSGDSVRFLDDDVANSVLARVIDEFQRREPGGDDQSKSALVLLPSEAIAFLSTLVGNRHQEKADTFARHTVALVAGDAGVSFRDAIPSTFLTRRSCDVAGNPDSRAFSLELPQLSPHPDCFCLPVDFEILRFVIEALGDSRCEMVAAQTASTLASDTFDVFYATLTPSPAPTALLKDCATATTTHYDRSHASFSHEFASFTPGDCDLLWGTMSIDDGARFFSTDSQLALMAQTAWDFDLFSAVQWPLAHRWRSLRSQRDVEPLRLQLITAGVQSWRTYYELEGSGAGSRALDGRLVLQVARWFYVLQAYGAVVNVLKRWDAEGQGEEKSVNALYLLGLSYARLEDQWKALALYRKCARLAPTRLKFQTQLAGTLLALQQLRHGPKA